MEDDTRGDLAYFSHNTHRITVMSYLLVKGGWVPKAWLNSSPENLEQGRPIVDDVEHPLPTKDAADAAAKKLAIEWIDAQSVSAAD